MSNLGEAVELYKQISSENSYYVDAQLKLTYLTFKRGSSIKALENLENTIKIIESNKLRPDLVKIKLYYNIFQGFLLEKLFIVLNRRFKIILKYS